MRFLDSLQLQRHEHHLHELNCSGATGQPLAPRAPFSLTKRAQGSTPGPPLSRHPVSVKRVNRVEERKLLPESETLWRGPQALRAHHNCRYYPWAPGRNSHSLAMCGNTRGGGEGDIDRLKPLKLTNHRSIRHHHHHRLSLFPLCQLSVSSLSATHQAPPCLQQGAERANEGAASASSEERALT